MKTIRLIVVVVASAVAGASFAAADEALFVAARVVDGDTLEIDGVRIRLYGIDAPESKQRCQALGERWACGQAATQALVGRIGGNEVACEKRDQDRYGRVVAVCRIGALDLNGWMVAQGWALAYRRYSDAYTAAGSNAQAAKRGVWRGEMMAPWQWRKGARLADTGAAEQRETGRCNIKGNISRNGTRIYHLPGGRHYEKTRIDSSKGERWFCTESAARAAGWRSAQR